MVRAVAGSGKSTTLTEGAQLVKTDRALFCAFNRHIAEALRIKLKGTNFRASTIHGVGYGILAKGLAGKLDVQERKYRELAKQYVDEAFPIDRCPTSHLELARQEVPEIEARPDAPVGTIASVPEPQLPGLVKPGDLILCRLNAPLIGWCLDLIKRQIQARVRGRDVARELADLARKIGSPYASFLPRLRQHAIEQRRRLEEKDVSEATIQMHEDMCLALEVCYRGFEEATSVEELCQAIDGLFSDDKAAIWFSTVHRAKGDESERVFILRPDKLPLVWTDQTAEEKQQEHNLLYVALTRSARTLVFLECPETVASGKAAERLALYGDVV